MEDTTEEVTTDEKKDEENKKEDEEGKTAEKSGEEKDKKAEPEVREIKFVWIQVKLCVLFYIILFFSSIGNRRYEDTSYNRDSTMC